MNLPASDRVLVVVRHLVRCHPFLSFPLPLEVLRGTDRETRLPLTFDDICLNVEPRGEEHLGSGPHRIVRVEFRDDCPDDRVAGGPIDRTRTTESTVPSSTLIRRESMTAGSNGAAMGNPSPSPSRQTMTRNSSPTSNALIAS